MGSECGEVPTSPTKKRHHIDPDENIAEPKAVEEGEGNHDEEQCGGAPKERSDSSKSGCKRSLKSVLHVAFNREFSIFEVTRKCKNYLSYMGVPMKNGGHVLFPEEVLLLMESWKVNATDGCRPLSLYDGIQIMGECGVPLYKYCAYAALRRAGFIVLRPDRLRVQSLPLNQESKTDTSEASSSGVGSSRIAYPRRLLDGFPTMEKNRLIFSQLHLNERLVPTEDLSTFAVNPNRFRIHRRPLREYRRQLRPNYWPDFDDISCRCSCWNEFASERKQAIASNRRAVNARRAARSKQAPSELDFEAHLSDRFMHSLPTEPAFRVICFDSRHGAMSCMYAHRNAGHIPLVLSIFDCGYVCFIEISGEPIDLRRYLEKLKKEAS